MAQSAGNALINSYIYCTICMCLYYWCFFNAYICFGKWHTIQMVPYQAADWGVRSSIRYLEENICHFSIYSTQARSSEDQEYILGHPYFTVRTARHCCWPEVMYCGIPSCPQSAQVTCHTYLIKWAEEMAIFEVYLVTCQLEQYFDGISRERERKNQQVLQKRDWRFSSIQTPHVLMKRWRSRTLRRGWHLL